MMDPQMTLMNGLTGGALIGLAAAVLLLFNGDIMGCSGIVNSVMLNPSTALSQASQSWKLVFLASFFLASQFLVDAYEPSAAHLNLAGYAVAGAWVGFGTKLGNGCTSGHGICGLARLSKRSFTAVMVFMGTAILTALYAPDAVGFLFEQGTSNESYARASNALTVGLAVLAVLASASATKTEQAKLGPAAVSGALFAVGLFISGMVYPTKVLHFLTVNGLWQQDAMWDPTLAMVMGGGVVVSFASYQLVSGHDVVKQAPKCPTPVCSNKFAVPTNTVVDLPLVLGAASFGVGWGLAGLCPGPALFAAAAGVPYIWTAWGPAYVAGAFCANQVKQALDRVPQQKTA